MSEHPNRQGEIEAQVDHHHRQAREAFHEFHRSGDTASLDRGNAHIAEADRLEARGAGTRRSKDGFEQHGEADPTSSRRTWYKQGSVGDEPLQQWQEAEDNGSLMGQLFDYATRSTLDKEHRTFEGAKLTGKLVAAPVKGTARVGKATTRGVAATAKGTKALASATRSAGSQVARKGKTAGRAILDAAAAHKKARGKGKTQRTKDQGDREQGKGKQQPARTGRQATPAKSTQRTPQSRGNRNRGQKGRAR